ncbi:hypothetical protein [Desulfobacter curvatus]|uniref:hypothetical protein n=1 Tax=Desulfobacter curvatus TaxID=2290 RepID=UPI0012FAFF10|nr:hypothetical protein [Desulfobacter curvatus]
MGGIILFLEAQAPKQALAIIDKGILQIKNSWELFFLKGYILWKAYNNYEEASKQILSSSLKKGAPSYLPLLAASFSLKTSNKMFIEGFYKIILNTVKDPAQKQLILKKMERLKERDG